MIPTIQANIVHSPPQAVPLKLVEAELGALRHVDAASVGETLLRSCTLTLVVLCDPNEDPAALEGLIANIVCSNPARVILLKQNGDQATDELNATVSVYINGEGDELRLVGEEIDLFPRGAQYETLPSAVLGLRVSSLPFVLYWRGQPDLDDPLFRALAADCDQILFDSQHFTARAERINNTIVRLRLEYPEVSFGDVNWQRIRPWRETIAHFFDDPANLVYLDQLAKVRIDFSVGFGGNQSAAILLMAWLASSLGWQVVNGSYAREGHARRARFTRTRYDSDEQVEIEVTIQVLDQPDCLPGELTGIRLETGGEVPEAVFQVKRAVGGFLHVDELTYTRFGERTLTLNLPKDSMVVTSELDAPRRDRNYHRALELLYALVSLNIT